MASLAERLRALRQKNNYRQKDIADKLGITESAYGYYEQGRRDPSYESLEALAELYGVTTDYLITGKLPSWGQSARFTLIQEREKRELTPKDLATMIGVSIDLYEDYEAGIATPDGLTIQRIAHVLGLTPEYLLGIRGLPQSGQANPMNENRFTFRDRFKDLVHELGLSTYELARKIDRDENFVCNLLDNPIRIPGAYTLNKIATVLNVTAAYLVGDVDERTNLGPSNAWYRLVPLGDSHRLTAGDIQSDGSDTFEQTPGQNPLGIELNEDELQMLREIHSDKNFMIMFRNFKEMSEEERRTFLQVMTMIRKKDRESK